MKTELIIIIIVVVIVIIFLIRRVSGGKPLIQVAEQITLNELESVMERLKSKTLEYDFFGITSNGTDCIYFVDDKGQINIDFEVMADEQKQYVEMLKRFALDNGIKVKETTYKNKPQYNDLLEAPVYKLEINADTKTATEIGRKIMTSVFDCNEATKFEVVP